MENNRAKQFLPFDALSGLKEALREKEIEYEEKMELEEDQNEILSRVLENLSSGQIIKIKWYENYKYVVTLGRIENLDYKNRLIRIKNKEIEFKNIDDITLLT